MSATLPKNLALVGEDLARATLQDAQRSARRRRYVTASIVLALLAITGTAAVANGWLFGETPTAQVVPSLGEGTGASRTLLTGLGPEQRVLSSRARADGTVCLALTGFEVNCVPTFAGGQQITWFIASPPGGVTTVWGIARDAVTAVEAVAADGETTSARLANDAFYVELRGGPPVRLVVHLRAGGSEIVPVAPCPAKTPNCPK